MRTHYPDRVSAIEAFTEYRRMLPGRWIFGARERSDRRWTWVGRQGSTWVVRPHKLGIEMTLNLAGHPFRGVGTTPDQAARVAADASDEWLRNVRDDHIDGEACVAVLVQSSCPRCPHVGDSSITCEVVELEGGGYVHHVAVNAAASAAGGEYHIHLDEHGEDIVVAAAEKRPRSRRSNQDFLDGLQRRHQRRSRR